MKEVVVALVISFTVYGSGEETQELCENYRPYHSETGVERSASVEYTLV